MEELTDKVLKEINQALGNLTNSDKLAKSPWLSSCLVGKRRIEKPDLSRLEALREVFTEVLGVLQTQARESAELLRLKYWEGLTGTQVNEKLLVGEISTYYNHRKEAVTNFATLLWEREQICESLASGADAEASAVAMPTILLPTPPEQPPMCSQFVGREAELAYFANRLTNEHVAIITGQPGVGKTTLAAALAQQTVESSHLFWHTFREQEDSRGIIWSLAGFFAWNGNDELWRYLQSAVWNKDKGEPPEMLLSRLIHVIRSGQYLFCLDDFEYVNDDPVLAWFVERLQGEVQAGVCSLIITSRQVPGFVSLDALEPLEGLYSTETPRFVHALGLSLPDDLTGKLHQATEGNTQLLTLAISALKEAEDPATLITRLSRVPNITRFLNLQIHKGLPQQAKDIMNAVAVLRSYTGRRAAIEAIVNADDLWETLDELVSKHLLISAASEADPHYRQHAMVGEFYYERLSLRRRQLLHQRAGAFYETDQPDPLQAVEHFVYAGEYARAADIAFDNTYMIITRGYSQVLDELLDSLVKQRLDADHTAKVNIARGEVYRLLGKREQAMTSYQLALEQLESLLTTKNTRERKANVCRHIGELLERESSPDAISWHRRGLIELAGDGGLEEAILRLRIGWVLFNTGKKEEAQQELTQSLQSLQVGPDHWRARALMNLGILHHSKGDTQQGEIYFGEALVLYEQAHDDWGIVSMLHNVGTIAEISGDWTTANDKYKSALERAKGLGSLEHQIRILLSIGILRTNQGNTNAGREFLSEALQLARKHHVPEYIVHTQSSLADLFLRINKLEAAESALHEAEQLAHQLELQGELSEIYRSWAHIQSARNQHEEAIEDAARAVHIAVEAEDPLAEGISRRVLGEVLFAAGQGKQAREAFQHSLELLNEQDPYEAARTKAQWGKALLSTKDATQGEELLCEAHETFDGLGVQHNQYLNGHESSDPT